MVRKRANRVFITRRFVFENERIFVCESIRHTHFQIAGIPFFSVLRNSFEFKTCAVENSCIPYARIEAALSAVKMVVAVVLEKVVLLSVKRKSRSAYAVAHSSDNRVEIRVFAKKSVRRVKSCHNVNRLSVFIRNEKFCNTCAVSDYLCLNAVVVFELVKFDAFG